MKTLFSYRAAWLLCVLVPATASCIKNLCERFPDDERCRESNQSGDMAVPRLSFTVAPSRLNLTMGGQLRVTVAGVAMSSLPTYTLTQNLNEAHGTTSAAGTNTFTIDLTSADLAKFTTGQATLSLVAMNQMGSSPIYLFSQPTWTAVTGATPASDNLMWVGVTPNQGILAYSPNGSGMNYFNMYNLQSNAIIAVPALLPAGIKGVSFPNETTPAIGPANLYAMLLGGSSFTYRACPQLENYICQTPSSVVNLPIASGIEVAVEQSDRFIAALGKDVNSIAKAFVHSIDVMAATPDQRFAAVPLTGGSLNNPQHAAFIDLDNDSRPDLLFLDSIGKPYVFVNMNQTSFGYDAKLSSSMAVVLGNTAASAIATGDYDGDGFTDLAVARGTVINIYSNQLDGTLIVNGSTTVSGGPVISMSAGDINGDSLPDIIFLTGSAVPRTIGARLNMHR